MPAQPFSELVRIVTGDQPPRTWSLLVTVFGDLVRTEGARIGGPALNRLTDLMGIRPEATRVALHRLRKEGWIDSRRSGRSSTYGLTPWGREQSASASPRIYGADPLPDRAWLVISDPRQGPVDGLGLSVAPGIWLSDRPPVGPETHACEIEAGASLPGWITTRVCDEDTCAQSAEISTSCAALLDQLDSTLLSRTEIAALRVLVVHAWRRVALRIPALPEFVFPQTWCGAECRARVAGVLDRLPAPDLASLEKEAAGARAA